jgi:hypothetical protein
MRATVRARTSEQQLQQGAASVGGQSAAHRRHRPTSRLCQSAAVQRPLVRVGGQPESALVARV